MSNVRSLPLLAGSIPGRVEVSCLAGKQVCERARRASRQSESLSLSIPISRVRYCHHPMHQCRCLSYMTQMTSRVPSIHIGPCSDKALRHSRIIPPSPDLHVTTAEILLLGCKIYLYLSSSSHFSSSFERSLLRP